MMTEEIPLIKEGLLEAKGVLAELAKKENMKKIVAYAIFLAMCFFNILDSQPQFFKQELVYARKPDISENIKNARFFQAEGYFFSEGHDVDAKAREMEESLYGMVVDYPIREMVPEIAKYDKSIAGLIIGIAKKESNWGKRSPSKNGKDCYNYWGYKGAGSLGTSLGYGCFATPEEGVRVIGARITQLAGQNINTPQKMVVWKCGSSCAGHPPENVKKWIADVSIYFNKISQKEII